MIACQQPARARDAGLDFVRDEQNIVLQGVRGKKRQMEWRCICRSEDDTGSPACTIGLQQTGSRRRARQPQPRLGWAPR